MACATAGREGIQSTATATARNRGCRCTWTLSMVTTLKLDSGHDTLTECLCHEMNIRVNGLQMYQCNKLMQGIAQRSLYSRLFQTELAVHVRPLYLAIDMHTVEADAIDTTYSATRGVS